MSLPSNEMQNSCEAESSACSTPARHFSQRLPGSQNEPANDWDTIPKRKTYSLSEKTHSLIPAIRRASRLLVRELGFMASTFAGTTLSPSSVHALIEISTSPAPPNPPTTATSLSHTLNLEKSSVSRMLKKLGEQGLVEEKQSEGDKREKMLLLTDKGREMVGRIDEYAEKQVSSALANLPAQATAESVLGGIESYAIAFFTSRTGTGSPNDEETMVAKEGMIERHVEIKQGYRPGILGRCLDMHMDYYSRTVDFGSIFESELSTGLGTLLSRLSPTNPNDEVWAAVQAGKIVGTVWMDGETSTSDPESPQKKTARLRAFVVDSNIHGKGVGRKLVSAAIEWADKQGFEETELWTFKGLNAARKLYDGFDFVLMEEVLSWKWGKELMVQHFVRKAGGKR